jgi:TPP-dependent pyruvate/acetoin dehydrogenase alpha subunit
LEYNHGDYESPQTGYGVIYRAMIVPEPLTSEDLLKLYYYLKLNRFLEDRLAALYRQAIITATVFTSRGQEAISVGTAYALGPDDFVSPLTRNMGTMLVRGIRPREIFTQYMGKVTSPTGGKERIHYFGDFSKGIVASLSVLGSMVPVMTGVALAAKIQGRRSVALTYLGEGAVSTGDFHEGMNLAAVLHLPFVLIIENNRYAYSTPASRAAAIDDFALRARCYGIPSKIVDGNDVLAVYAETRHSLERARAGLGPSIIEAKTMRMHGHSDADTPWYVPKDEFEEWQRRDPLDRFERLLRDANVLDDTSREAIESRISEEVESDLQYALDSPFPPPETAVEAVYTKSP